MHTGPKLRKVYKLAGSLDAEHRTVQCSPDLYPERFAKRANTGRSSLRPVPGVRCLTLAEPGSLHTGRTSTASGASGPASEKHSRDFSKFPTGAIEKYALHFLKKAPNQRPRNPSSLYPSNSTSFSKCANTTKCKPTCACVLAFSQSFSLKELS